MLKKDKLIVIILLIMLVPFKAFAGRGCCSHHGGVAGCNSYGRQVCADGTLSPSCTCTPPKVYGCTDSNAYNYDPNANTNNGSCKYYTYGCTDSKAYNYDSKANKDDGSCKYYIYGCTDINAENYKSDANKDDGSCKYRQENEQDVTDEEDNSEFEDDNKDNDSDSSNLTPIGIITLVGGAYIYGKSKKK